MIIDSPTSGEVCSWSNAVKTKNVILRHSAAVKIFVGLEIYAFLEKNSRATFVNTTTSVFRGAARPTSAPQSTIAWLSARRIVTVAPRNPVVHSGTAPAAMSSVHKAWKLIMTCASPQVNANLSSVFMDAVLRAT